MYHSRAAPRRSRRDTNHYANSDSDANSNPKHHMLRPHASPVPTTTCTAYSSREPASVLSSTSMTTSTAVAAPAVAGRRRNREVPDVHVQRKCPFGDSGHDFAAPLVASDGAAMGTEAFGFPPSASGLARNAQEQWTNSEERSYSTTASLRGSCVESQRYRDDNNQFLNQRYEPKGSGEGIAVGDDDGGVGGGGGDGSDGTDRDGGDGGGGGLQASGGQNWGNIYSMTIQPDSARSNMGSVASERGRDGGGGGGKTDNEGGDVAKKLDFHELFV